MTEQADRIDPWPFRHLVLRTPLLELRPDDDKGLIELAAVASAGVHPPDGLAMGQTVPRRVERGHRPWPGAGALA